MGIFSRLGSLIKSNLNDAISKAEDPEKMLNQVILEMGQQLVEAKKQVAVAIADEKRLAKQYEKEAMDAREWEKKAMMAVRAGDDALAKEALVRKTEHDKLANEYQKQWQLQKDASEKLKNALRNLDNKIEEAKRKKNLLIARKQRAEATKTIQQTLNGITENSAFETFERMSQKVDQLEAEAESIGELNDATGGDSLDAKFARLEATGGADDALASLKAKMGLAASSPAPQLESNRPQVNINVQVSEPANVTASGGANRSTDDLDF
jgi:phage shock protein A